MDLTYRANQPVNLVTWMRQIGYHPIHDWHEQKDSWARTLGGSHYPRFHMYITEHNLVYTFSLHLDQKQSTIAIKGLRRHAGEYDTPIVEKEAGRIQRWIDYLSHLSP